MKEEQIVLSRQVAASLLPVLRSRQGETPSPAQGEAFVQKVHAVLSDPVSRSVVCEEIARGLASGWPGYVSEPEPGAESALGRRLFPKAHAGNVRRLLTFVWGSPEGQGLAPSTRAYVMLSELILAGLSPWSGRNYTAFTRYLQGDLGVPDAFDIRRVNPYWRHLPLSAWAADRARADAPRNAEAVMAFASMVRRCICSGGNVPDERLWRAPK